MLVAGYVNDIRFLRESAAGKRLLKLHNPIIMASGMSRFRIVHELLHLKVPHHGKLFKALEKLYLDEGEG